MNAAVFVILSAVFMTLELYLRAHALIVPLVPDFLFYFTVVSGLKKGVGAAVLLGIAADLMTGRVFPVSAFTFGAVAVFAEITARRGKLPETFLSHVLPGAAISLAVWGIPALSSFESLRASLVFLPPVCFFNVFLLPLMILLLDTAAEKLSLPLYADARLNEDRNE